MTDATVEQQGEPKRRKEHPEMPQAADGSSSSSSSSSSSESSADTEMGLVDMRTILSENSETESRRRGGPVTLDLTEWEFSKADCRNNSKPLLLIGSPIDSGRGDKERARAVLHMAFICELYKIQVHGGPVFPSHTFPFRRHLVMDFMNRFPDTFQTVTDQSLFGPNVPHGMNTLTRWLTNSGCIAQALSSSTNSSTVSQTIMSAMSQQLQSDLSAVGTTDPLQHHLPLPKLDILAVDEDEEPKGDVKGGPLDPHEVKAARQKET